MFKSSLIHQILLWVFVPLAVVTSFTYFQLNGLVNHYTSYHQKSMRESLDQIDSNLRSILQTNDQLADLYSSNKEVLNSIQARNADSLFQIGNSLINSGLVDIFTVTDENGLVLARGHDEFHFNDSLKNVPYYRIVASGSRFSGIGMLEGKLALISVTQINAYDTVFVGTLVVGRYINESVISGMEKTMLLDISISPESKLASSYSVNVKHEMSMTTPIRIPTLDKSFFHLHITRNIHEEQREIGVIKNRVLLITFIIAGFTLIFVYWALNMLLRPMRNLNFCLQKYDNGEMKLSELGLDRKQFQADNELSNIVEHVISTLTDLEAAKNKMSRQTEELRKARAEALKTNKYLEDLSLTLEQQVEHRTKELNDKNKELLFEIEERQAVEKRVESLNNTLESVINKMPSWLIGVDPQKRISFWNAGAEKQSGHSLSSVRGLEAEEALSLLGFDDKACSDILQTRSHSNPVKIDIFNQENIRHLSVINFPYLAENELPGTVIRIDDISTQVWMEDAILQAEKLKSIGVLAGGIAHDFNNLLTAILGSLSLCLRDPSLSAKTMKMLTTAENASHRAKGLSNQLLTFSKGGNPVKEETDLKKIIKEYTAFATLGDRIECQFEFSDNLWHVLADKDQISQVFQNIINNSVQAIQGKNGLISVSCRNVEVLPPGLEKTLVDGQYIEIVIRDNGSGMAHDVLKHVFDPYFSTKQDGNGLGMAICHSIVKKHNGLITATSKLGKGSEFTIYLPAIDTTSTSIVADRQEHALSGLNILVMDDDPVIIGLLQEILEVLGHHGIFTENGDEAVLVFQNDKAEKQEIDLVITDLTVTRGMGGKDCAERILQIDPSARIIVSSGYSKDPVMEDFEKYGFCGAVSKPYTVEELRLAIIKAVQKEM